MINLVVARRPNGRIYNFGLSYGVIKVPVGQDFTLVQSGSTWQITDHNDTTETYVQVGASAYLSAINYRGGYGQTLTYNANGNLTSVTDSYGRSLNFTYSGTLLQSVTTPDGLTMAYGYDASGANGSSLDRLRTATYSTTPATTATYNYDNSAFPFSITSIVDEAGVQSAGWSYDTNGRALQSFRNTEETDIQYIDGSNETAVTHSGGLVELYDFTIILGSPFVSEIDRQASATTTAATRLFTHDTNGFLTSETDWNGNLTTYVRDSRDQPTTIVEASGSPQARTSTITYLSTYRLPSSIVRADRSFALTYDSAGNLLSRTETDATSTTAPYTTQGQARTWQYTWSNGLLASIQEPRTDVTEVTRFAHDGSGALTSITNALGQTTSITQHLSGGLPTTIVDPNGVTTTRTYDARLRLLSTSVATKAGTLTTRTSYDAAGRRVSVTLPDGSATTFSYNSTTNAMTLTDLLGQTILYERTPDDQPLAVSNETAAGTATFTKSYNYDAIRRLVSAVDGDGNATTVSYDNNGNALSITDALGRKGQSSFDALNRAVKTVNPAGGVSTSTYNSHDKPLSVTDANGNTTSYVYDGFSDIIGVTSPDTGATIDYYDTEGNLVQSQDAAGVVNRITYDALNRPLSVSYPGNPSENVTYVYDQGSFGIGRLSSVTDAAGKLVLSYDERGNVLSERRLAITGTTFVTSYYYDAAGRVSRVTYPSGVSVGYTHDSMGRVTSVTGAFSGAQPVTLASAISYLPFGPACGLTDGNGYTEARTFDAAYRLTSITNHDQALTYTRNAVGDITQITDANYAANSQALGYDALDRITSASANTYGALSWTYDPVGNRLTDSAGGSQTSYTYNPKTNRLASTSNAGQTLQQISYSSSGLTTSVAATGASATCAYSQSHHLAQVTGAGATWSYVYDAFGRQVVKSTVATGVTRRFDFQYDRSGRLIQDQKTETGTTGAAELVNYVYLGERPIAAFDVVANAIYFIHANADSSPFNAVGTDHSLAWQSYYQPFGTPIGTLANPKLNVKLRAPGQYYDGATGYNHNGFRDYAPTLGRYIESDPIGLGGGYNTYAYALQNPLNLIDPTGLHIDPPGDESEVGGVFQYLASIVRDNPLLAVAVVGELIPGVAEVEGVALVVEEVVAIEAPEIVAAAEEGVVAVEGAEGPVSTYIDTTATGARITNITTDVTGTDAGVALESNGYVATTSADGQATIFTNSQGNTYVLRPSGSAPSGEALDFYPSNGNAPIKINLGGPSYTP